MSTLLLSTDKQFLIEKLPHFRTINLAAHSKLMIIATFGQKGLINLKYFVCKDSQTSADYKLREKSQFILPELFLKALHLVHLSFL